MPQRTLPNKIFPPHKTFDIHSNLAKPIIRAHILAKLSQSFKPVTGTAMVAPIYPESRRASSRLLHT